MMNGRSENAVVVSSNFYDGAELGPANGMIDFAEAVVIVSVAVEGGYWDAQDGVAEVGADDGDESGGG
jgi:hypothetical protein